MISPRMQRKNQAEGCGDTNKEAVVVAEEGDYGLGSGNGGRDREKGGAGAHLRR